MPDFGILELSKKKKNGGSDHTCLSAANRSNVCRTESGQTLAMMLMAAVFAIPKKPQREGCNLRRTNNELRTSVARVKRGQ